MKNTRVILVGNYKGGVGKTTSVLNFAEYFAEKGKKVLVLDLDPQSSLSEILVRNNGAGAMNLEGLKNLKPQKTLNYVLDLWISKIKKYNSLSLQFGEGIVQHYGKGRYDFIASSLFYRDALGVNLGLDELVLRMEDNIEYLSILKVFLDSVLEKKEYDFVLIDCPPANNLLTRAAFLLSDYYIVPTILDTTSTNGVAHYINTVTGIYEEHYAKTEDAELVRHYFGEEPELIGVFYTFIDNRNSYATERERFSQTLKRECDGKEFFIFQEDVNDYVDIARSTAFGTMSCARRDYVALTDRVLQRIEELEKTKMPQA